MDKQIKSYGLSRKGFTLVEVMVAIFVSSIVLASAFMIWSKVQMGITRSYSRQTLQNELRKIANHMQNDFKSIKFHDKDDSNDPDSDKGVKITGDDKNFTMSFQKFKEAEETDSNKLSMDVVEDVKYSLNSNVLMRTGSKGNKLLSAHCEGIHITTAAGDDSDSDEYQNASEEVKTAKEAQLNIEITGKIIVPGTGEELFHIEKTSVIMRNEYYKKINNNYKSNFDLAKLNAEEVTGEGAYQGLEDGEIDPSTLSTDALNTLKESEQEVLKSLMGNLKDINETISDVAPDNVPWYQKLWANVSGLFGNDENAYNQFKELRAALKDADTVAKTEDAMKNLKTKIENQEKTFYGKAYTAKSYDSMTEDEKTTFKRAYDMAVQEKTIKDAYDKLEDKSGGLPKSNIDLQKEIVNSSDASEEQKKDAQNILDVYNNIKLDWMEDSDSEIGIYKANKQLMDQANTKLELLKAKEITDKSIANINTELNKRS